MCIWWKNKTRQTLRGDYGVMAAQGAVAALEWVQIPLVSRVGFFGGIF